MGGCTWGVSPGCPQIGIQIWQDYILFKKSDFVTSACTKDNTGRREYIELMM